MKRGFNKTIGILGGMGPVASADTYAEIVRLCQVKYGAVEDMDFPRVFLYSLPLRNFTHKGFSKNGVEHKAIVRELKQGLAKLERAGVDIIVIDCNTVHYFLSELRRSVRVPIVNLVELTVQNLKQALITKAGIIASDASRRVGLYAKPLEQAGIEALEATAEEQSGINNIIKAVMTGRSSERDIRKINAIASRLLRSGAERVILGCTEISHLASKLKNKNVLIDSQALAIDRALALAKQ